MEIRILQEQELDNAAGLCRYVFDVCVRDRMEFEQSIPYIEDYLAVQNLKKLCMEGQLTVWGAFHEGMLIAVSALQTDGMITILYVLPNWARRGIGSTLLATMRSYAGSNYGLEQVRLNATPAWQAAYFARQGFYYADKTQRVHVPYVPMVTSVKGADYTIRRHVSGKVIAFAAAGCFAFATALTILFLLFY